jgi:hypothetical protein
MYAELTHRVRKFIRDMYKGTDLVESLDERNHRFLEEALELLQACGCTKEEVLQVANYVFSKPKGDKAQELGGTMVTLTALSLTNNLDLMHCFEKELELSERNVELIRNKRLNKPSFTPELLSTEIPNYLSVYNKTLYKKIKANCAKPLAKRFFCSWLEARKWPKCLSVRYELATGIVYVTFVMTKERDGRIYTVRSRTSIADVERALPDWRVHVSRILKMQRAVLSEQITTLRR